MLWILNFVSSFICYQKCLRIAPLILLYVCNLSSKSLLYSDIRYPRYLKSVTCSIILSFITIFILFTWFPHTAIDFVFVLDIPNTIKAMKSRRMRRVGHVALTRKRVLLGNIEGNRPPVQRRWAGWKGVEWIHSAQGDRLLWLQWKRAFIFYVVRGISRLAELKGFCSMDFDR